MSEVESAGAMSDESAPSMPAPSVLGWIVGVLCCAVLATGLYVAFRSAGHSGGYFVIVSLYALSGVAAFYDAALRRIPNAFTYTALILVLCLTMVVAPVLELMDCAAALEWLGANRGVWGGVALESLKGFALCAAIGVASFAVGGLGGGDVKVLVAIGTLAGWSLTLSILVNTLAVALLLGTINLLARGALIRTLQGVTFHLYLLIQQRDFTTPIAFKRTESPFCLSLFLGLVALPFVNFHAIVVDALPQIA